MGVFEYGYDPELDTEDEPFLYEDALTQTFGHWSL